MSLDASILGALFGAPALSLADFRSVNGEDETGDRPAEEDKDVKVEGVAGEGEGEGEPTLSSIINGYLNNPDSKKYIITLIVFLCIAGVLLFAVFILTGWTFIRIQWMLYKKGTLPPSDPLDNSSIKKAYKDTDEYLAMNPSIFSKYPFRAIFYLTAVGFTIMILAILIQYQLKIMNQDKDGGAPGPYEEAPKNPLNDLVFWLTFIFLYLFFICYYFIEYKFYVKIKDYSKRITDYNQFIIELMPANFKVLSLLSSNNPSSSAEAQGNIYPQVLKDTNPTIKELARTICMINLYDYYVEKKNLYNETSPTAFTCFDPFNRLTGSKSCFSDYLIQNDSYVPNKIHIIKNIVERMDTGSAIYNLFRNKNTEIMMSVDKNMTLMNKLGSCMGSSYVYQQFLRMNTRVFIAVFIPVIYFAVKILVPILKSMIVGIWEKLKSMIGKK